MFQKIINFIKYHNAFTIGLGLILVVTASAMASEDIRNTVIGEEIITEKGVDNSQLLSVDLDNFNINLKINNILEDEENYYLDYSFNTFGVKDNLWQPILKTERFTVNKTALGNRDLGIYLTEELGEVAQEELTYLKEAQKTERERGLTQIVKTTDYTGLIGLTLDLKNKILPGYEPIVKPQVVEVVQEPIVEEPIEEIPVPTEQPLAEETPVEQEQPPEEEQPTGEPLVEESTEEFAEEPPVEPLTEEPEEPLQNAPEPDLGEQAVEEEPIAEESIEEPAIEQPPAEQPVEQPTESQPESISPPEEQPPAE